MRRIARRAISGGAVFFFLAGCATAPLMKVDADYEDENVSMLAGYRKYSWLVQSPGPGVDPKEAALAASVTQSIDATLAVKGYRIDGQMPDFLIAWYVNFEPKERVTTVQTGYGRYRHPGLPPAMPPLKMVHEYTEGTLILDVLDAATKSLVWRGTAQAEVLPSVDVSTREARIREAVRRILERFPPKA
jgi:hypothetical protein